ncbi:uncharacterized protein [Rutidosis leptorrhynchoides]|uniref:uncharacterized protein n=1 Tax=Rutidosis leptorrhynchoides TaxID=125765 RepID=UPI003A99CCA8
MSLNIRGFGVGKESKIGWVKGLCRGEKPNIVMLQETKLHTVDLNWVRGLWGNNNCNFVQKEMVGKSGGQLIIWDVDCFDVTNSFIHDYCIGIRGKWKNADKEFNILNVYGPHDDLNKQKLWDFLHNLVSNNSNQAWMIGGDFNEVRNVNERFNCNFIESRAKKFNDFIENSKLLDIPLGGSYFHTVALERGKSDHCLIILKDDVRNFGPKPIKVFDDWLNIEGVKECMKEVWAEDVGGGSRLDCGLRNKLKKNQSSFKDKKFTKIWQFRWKEWFQREKIKSNMLKQKARVRWVLEGDENTKYFHSAYGLESAIEESEIVEAINDCGSGKAPGPDGFNIRFFKKFWDVIKGDVINAISWFWEKREFSKGCNASFVTLIPKKNDPITLDDYRPKSLIGSFYKTVAKILSNRLRKVIPRLVGSKQSTFSRERYILDGVFVANETIEFLKSNRKQGLIFKVDFEKACCVKSVFSST